MTLFDIFYQHTEWWCNPELGHDTHGKYGEVLKEMEDCALEYARSIKDTGERWKRVIENETRELCRPNHYSWNLRGDKKKWHDTVVRDFLIRIRKAIEHCYGYNFTELPKSILPSYGIYCYERSTNRKPQQKHIEAPQQANRGNSGELTGNGNETPPEGKKQPIINKEDLPTIYDDEVNKDREQQVLYNAIQRGWMRLNGDGKSYVWKKNPKLLTLMCSLLYWGDEIEKKVIPIDAVNTKFVYTLKKNNVYNEDAARLQILFGGIDISNKRTKLHSKYQESGILPEGWEGIDRLF